MSRMTTPLSDTEIKKSKIKEKDYKLSDGKGLYLTIKSTGSKLWRFDFVFNGLRKSMSFGSYPLVSLKNARMKREETRELLINNIDPIVNKKNKSSFITFEEVLNKWINITKIEWQERTYKRNTGILNKYLLPSVRNLEFSTVNRAHLLKIFTLLVDKNYLETANKLYNLLSSTL